MDLGTLSWLGVRPGDTCVEKKVTYCVTEKRGERSNERDKPLRFGTSKQAGLARRHTHNTQGRQHRVVMEELSAFRPF